MQCHVLKDYLVEILQDSAVIRAGYIDTDGAFLVRMPILELRALEGVDATSG